MPPDWTAAACERALLPVPGAGDDYSRAGEASSTVKNRLKRLGVSPEAIRRVSIALYEGEINMVIHGGRRGSDGHRQPRPGWIWSWRTMAKGIPDIEKAMQEGYSTASEEARSLGFGAGMGLPNMKKYTDTMQIESTVGVGTTVRMTVLL